MGHCQKDTLKEEVESGERHLLSTVFPAEDCEDGVEYNEEWENEEYDPDKV